MIHTHELITHCLNDDQPTVLAFIYDVQGSAYRKEGAWMVMKQDKSRIGLISGGCLEDDLHLRANQLYCTGKSEMVQYDLSAEDDLGWGIGQGCNGIVSLYLRDLDSTDRQILSQLNDHLQQNEPILFLQSLTNSQQYMYMTKERTFFGTWNRPIPNDVADILLLSPPFLNYTELRELEEEKLFIQLLWPKPNLYIIGAGEDTRALATLAARTGYLVHMIDWRESLCTREHFPTAHSIQVGDVEFLLQTIPFNPLDSVVIMTHSFQLDKKIISYLVNIPLFYVGLLGPRKRTNRSTGGSIPDWLHSPIGLSIGADGPEEIAISIVAELIKTKQAKHS